MPPKTGPLLRGHPYINIQVSADKKSVQFFLAMIDTGFSGFVSVPAATAEGLRLKAHAHARYTLANGRSTDPVPLAEGYACAEGDAYVKGLISLSENASAVVGMNFLRRTGNALILFSTGVVLMDEQELHAALRGASSS